MKKPKRKQKRKQKRQRQRRRRKKQSVVGAAPRAPRPSRSQKLQAVEAFDECARVRKALHRAAQGVDEFAGLPLPLEGEELIIEPGYRFAEALSNKPDAPAPADDECGRIRNWFYCTRKRADVAVIEKPDGTITYGLDGNFNHVSQALRTVGCSAAWGIEQEGNALQTLAGMLRHANFKQYLLTGAFLESSRRSGVTYMFRKLRPTIAIAGEARWSWSQARIINTGSMRILAALCMHPIGYYKGSWAGAMCPTDDVIAHLSMMRGDEPRFWKDCNQIMPHRAEAGL